MYFFVFSICLRIVISQPPPQFLFRGKVFIFLLIFLKYLTSRFSKRRLFRFLFDVNELDAQGAVIIITINRFPEVASTAIEQRILDLFR